MAQEIPSGWVPDRLPEFKKTPIPVTINDPLLTKEFLDVASSLKMRPVDLYRKIITFGLIIAMAENDPNSTVVERDQMGKERKIDLMTETYSVEIKDVDNIMPNKKLTLSIPGELSNELMDIANRHHTTMGVVLKQMFIFGVKVAKSQTNHEKSYITRDQQGNDQQISLL